MLEAFIYSLSFTAGSQGSWSLSQLSLGKRQGTRRTGRQFSPGLTYRDNQPQGITFTPTGNLESLINLTCMSLGCGRNELEIDVPNQTQGEQAHSTP